MTKLPIHLVRPSIAIRRYGSSARSYGATSHGESKAPLLRFESAVLRYPPQQEIDSADRTTSSDLEIVTDRTRAHCQDLLLEIQDVLQRNSNEQLQQLQPHWGHFLSHEHYDPPYLHPFDLHIYPNTECKHSSAGGHILLGRNGSGKTLISKSLIHTIHNSDSHKSNPYLHSGSLHIHNQQLPSESSPKHFAKYNNPFLSHVSFESHSQLISNPMSVYKALIPQGGNRLSPTAQFLIVRLGMFPLLQRQVSTLSTGEIRRVLLIRALVMKPSLLLLDNVMDGLDAQGRDGVHNILERVLAGFRMDILVQGVSAKDTARTQILLSTLRAEEISNGFGRVTFVDGERLRTEERGLRSGVDLVKCLKEWGDDEATYHEFVTSMVGTEKQDNNDMVNQSIFGMSSMHEAPSKIDINNFWESGRSRYNMNEDGKVVEANDLKIIRDDTILLSTINWTVQRAERWHLAGANGAGKSTLGRLLLRKSMHTDLTDVSDATIVDGSLKVTQQQSHDHVKRGGVGWVSTELHLHAAENWLDYSVSEIMAIGSATLFNLDRNKHNRMDVISRNSLIDMKTCSITLQWLGLIENTMPNYYNHPFFARKFGSLSQGQQKLLLIASSIAQRPSLLILDEPCQGLDVWNRMHVLDLLQLLCENTDMALVYITHHEEELIGGIDKALRLESGKIVHCEQR